MLFNPLIVPLFQRNLASKKKKAKLVGLEHGTIAII